MTHYIRIWQPADIENIKQHLIVIGGLTGGCAACRELGISYAEAKACPKCGTRFNFIAVRQTSRHNVKKIKERRPDLTFIDYEDYRAITGKKSARDFFK